MAVRELSASPSLTGLYAKAMAGAGASLPVLRSLPGLRNDRQTLPDIELVLPNVEVDQARLADYCRVCTFEIADTLPATYPHVLAFPLHMQLMSDGAFPFPMIGLVHIANRIELRRPIGARARLTFRVRTSDLRPHERGRQFDVLAEASAGSEVVWTSASTYLRRESSARQRAFVHMPCAIARGIPNRRALSECMWIGLRSPETAA